MKLTPGTRLGPYQIETAAGAGGMGEVYRARDTRLDRVVAIKVLPAALAQDPLFRERFAREARAISQLDHPHICTLHDVGEQDGLSYLVMAYLDGETLADRLARGRLPVHEALVCAIEIAEALDAAHRAGIVHRDLKPANIKLTSSGARLLDFGLARTGVPMIAGAAASMLPTSPAALTQQGTILGTLQYMAPEQLEGAEADTRSDIFAFGAVLYEMVTGVKAFAGNSQASIISAIIRDTPQPMSALQPQAPAALVRVTTTCLEKRPDDRWQTMRDLRRELKWIAEAPPALTPVDRATGSRIRRWLPWAVTAAALLAAGAWGVRGGVSGTTAESTTRLEISLPIDAPYSVPSPGRNLALSPDGQLFVYATARGQRRLYRRDLSRLAVDPMAGTENAAQPFFSPDGRSLAFFTSGGELKKLSLDGGPPSTLQHGLTNGQWAFGAWRDEHTLAYTLFGPNLGGLRQIAADGGMPNAITTSGQFPAVVPSSGDVVLTDRPTGVRRLMLVHADGSQSLLLDNASGATVTTSGHLLFTRDNVVMAAPFDARSAIVGPAKTLSEPVLIDQFGVAQLAVSRSGTLAYVPSTVSTARPLLGWVSPSGTFSEIGPLPPGTDRATLSPDGTAVALSQFASDRVFVMDLARRVTAALPLSGRMIETVAWHADSKRLTLGGTRLTLFDPESGKDLQLVGEGAPKRDASWTPDGRNVVYQTFDPATTIETLAVDASDQRATAPPRPALTLGNPSGAPALSPDGQWLAYQAQSSASGRSDVYIARFPEGTGRIQVTPNGGNRPFWSRSGDELFFTTGPGVLQAVSIRFGAKADVGMPRTLFRLGDLDVFAVAKDGKILAIQRPPSAPPQRVVVVQHWLDELERLVPHR